MESARIPGLFPNNCVNHQSIIPENADAYLRPSIVVRIPLAKITGTESYCAAMHAIPIPDALRVKILIGGHGLEQMVKLFEACIKGLLRRHDGQNSVQAGTIAPSALPLRTDTDISAIKQPVGRQVLFDLVCPRATIEVILKPVYNKIR